MRRSISLAALALALSLLLCACAAKEAAPVPTEKPIVQLPPLPSGSPAPDELYETVPVYFDGLLSDKAYLRDGTVYISPAALCAHHGLESAVELEADSVCFMVPGLELEAALGREYMQANGRYLYTPEGYLIIGEEFFFSAHVIERALGVNVIVSEDGSRADIDAATLNLLSGGKDYYEIHYPTEDFFWLSHIIYAESREQPLAGQIGVGNVVLNRIESDIFPSTVFDVIFDRRYTVQFEPISTGGVYAQPDEMSVIAACLCLEGYNTVGDSLYFINPEKADSTWFDSALSHVITIGQHKFYS